MVTLCDCLVRIAGTHRKRRIISLIITNAFASVFGYVVLFWCVSTIRIVRIAVIHMVIFCSSEYCSYENNNKDESNTTNSNAISIAVQYRSQQQEVYDAIILPSELPSEGTTFDFDKLKEILGVLTKNLNRVIERNFLSSGSCKKVLRNRQTLLRIRFVSHRSLSFNYILSSVSTPLVYCRSKFRH